MAMLLLNQLLNLHDGFSDEEWLRRARTTMLQIFPPEDAFTTVLDLENVSCPFLFSEQLMPRYGLSDGKQKRSASPEMLRWTYVM